MPAIVSALRTGDWITRQRLRLWALAVLATSAAGLLFLVVTSDGLNDYQGRPLGTDFSNVYAAGSYVLEGRPAAPFDWSAQYQREQKIFGAATPFYGWHYPPFFLFIAGALALLPYPLALALWQGVTLVLYLFSMRAILIATPSPIWDSGKDKIWFLLALAFPAVFVNLGHGHNGFLTAAFVGGALVALDRRPFTAGVLFGLMAYKPQFGLMIPLALAAAGRWRTFFTAAATVAVLAFAATLVFGVEVWRAFFASTHLTRLVVLEAGDTGWQKIQSVFSWARMWGGGVPLAYAAQGVVTLALIGALIWLWRSAAPFPLKAAALAIAAILATPYSLDYDLMVLAPAIAYFAADGMTRGFLPWEKTALALLWFVPLFTRVIAQYTFMPLGVWAMLLVCVLVLRRAAAGAIVRPA